MEGKWVFTETHGAQLASLEISNQGYAKLVGKKGDKLSTSVLKEVSPGTFELRDRYKQGILNFEVELTLTVEGTLAGKTTLLGQDRDSKGTGQALVGKKE